MLSLFLYFFFYVFFSRNRMKSPGAIFPNLLFKMIAFMHNLWESFEKQQNKDNDNDIYVSNDMEEKKNDDC